MPKELATMAEDQKQFMLAGSQSVGEVNPDQLKLYLKLIKEEYIEVTDAESPAELLKELNDLIVVTLGAIHSLATEADGPWNSVHGNNMLKVMYPPKKDPVTKKILKSAEAIANKPLMMQDLSGYIAT